MTDVSLSASQSQSSLLFVEVTPEPRLRKKKKVAASDFLCVCLGCDEPWFNVRSRREGRQRRHL